MLRLTFLMFLGLVAAAQAQPVDQRNPHFPGPAGVVVGNPTGGDKGPGTFNASGDIYRNGQSITITIPSAPLLGGSGGALQPVTAINGPSAGGSVQGMVGVPVSGSTGAFTSLTAPVSGDLAGSLPGPSVDGMSGCGRCFLANNSGSGNLAQLQIWAPDAMRAKIVPFSGTPDISWWLQPANCGGVTVTSDTWNAAFTVAPPHGCNVATFTGTISGTTLTVSNIVGPISQGQIITGVGVTANTVITGGSGTSWTVNNSQTIGPVSMSAAAVSKHQLLIRPANTNEISFQFAVSDGSAPVFESGLSVAGSGLLVGSGGGNGTAPAFTGTLTIADAGGSATRGTHVAVAQTVLPAVTNGTLDAHASDVTGTVTLTAANPVVTFRVPYATTPHVVISSPTGTAFTYTVTANAVTFAGGGSGNTVTYMVIQ